MLNRKNNTLSIYMLGKVRIFKSLKASLHDSVVFNFEIIISSFCKENKITFWKLCLLELSHENVDRNKPAFNTILIWDPYT